MSDWRNHVLPGDLRDAFTCAPLPWPHWLAPDGSVLLINADCREVLDTITPGCVHLAITSPPYNVGKDYGAAVDDLAWPDYYAFLKVLFAGIRERLCVGGRFAVNVQGYMVGNRTPTPHHHATAEIAYALGRYQLLAEIVWDQGHAGSRTAWGSWLSPSAPRFPCPFEIVQIWCLDMTRRPDRSGPGDMTSEQFTEAAYALWRFSGRADHDHPATFPLELPTRLIRMLAWPGELVLEPCSGVATTAVACIQTARRCIAIEIDPGYYAIGVERCQKAFADTATFFGKPVQGELTAQEAEDAD